METTIKNLTGKYNKLLAATMISGSLLSSTPVFAQEGDTSPPVNDDTVTVTVDESAGDLFDQSWLEKQGSPIDFQNPLVLLGWPPALLLLWFALRSMPLRPKDVEFGPMFVLEQLETLEAEPNQMKILEKMLWMGALTGAFIAAADPTQNQQASFAQDGPILIAADTGWASAANWNTHRETIRELIRHAYNDNREISFLSMAVGENGEAVQVTDPMNAALALSYLDNLSPVPWPSDREAAIAALDAVEGSYGATYWMSNGLRDDFTLDFSASLNSVAPLTVYDENDTPHLFMTPVYRNGEYDITIRRADAGAAEELSVSAYDEGRNVLGSEIVRFEEGARTASITFVPADHGSAADRIFSFSIDHEASAGAVVLVDEDYKPRSVGIASRNNRIETESLFSEERFLYAALQPHTDLYLGSIEELIDSGNISVLMIPDSMPINSIAQGKIEEWMNAGGTVVRFAGPNLVSEAHTDNPLLPVNLRQGARALADSIVADGDGLRVQDFDDGSPFSGIEPDHTVSISQQVVVQPTPGAVDRAWARFSDGTPLVTAAERGNGQIILFHTTANTLWSELSLSNNFVEMLVATVGQSNSVEDTSDYELPEMLPLSVLNANGELRNPSAIVQPLTQSVLNGNLIGPEHRAGLYGTSLMTIPYNVSDAVGTIETLGALPESIDRQFYANAKNEVKGWLWGGALALAVIGGFVLTGRRGLWGRREKNNNTEPAPTL
jgi:hypothetical protein